MASGARGAADVARAAACRARHREPRRRSARRTAPPAGRSAAATRRAEEPDRLQRPTARTRPREFTELRIRKKRHHRCRDPVGPPRGLRIHAAERQTARRRWPAPPSLRRAPRCRSPRSARELPRHAAAEDRPELQARKTRRNRPLSAELARCRAREHARGPARAREPAARRGWQHAAAGGTAPATSGRGASSGSRWGGRHGPDATARQDASVDRFGETLATIGAAFADAPRPSDRELLHERCFDDNDIAALYGVAHWRELDDATVEREYAALSFLSPAGFRHFIPAYLGFALRHPDTARRRRRLDDLEPLAARHEDPDLQVFTAPSSSALDERQRAAAVDLPRGRARARRRARRRRGRARADRWWRPRALAAARARVLVASSASQRSKSRRDITGWSGWSRRMCST